MMKFRRRKEETFSLTDKGEALRKAEEVESAQKQALSLLDNAKKEKRLNDLMSKQATMLLEIAKIKGGA